MIAHGALDHAELAARGLSPTRLLDFSSNLNPCGPPAGVRAALAALDPAPYPDRSCHRLRQMLAGRHGCDPAQILVGNGANELIHLIARALLRPGDRSLIVEPTFGEYAHASRLAGAQVISWRADDANGFALDLAAITELIATSRPRVTWLCAPNNPTGVTIPEQEILAIAETCAARNGLLVVDRAYWAFLRPAHAEPPTTPSILRLYSLTKSYAIAGLRLGYLLAGPDLVTHIGAYQPAWSVGSAALAAGEAALADPDYLMESVPRLWAYSDMLHDGLQSLGLTVHRAEMPFVLARTGDGAATRERLLSRGIVVRDCASFGLPAWVRIAPRLPEETAQLLRAWQEMVTNI